METKNVTMAVMTTLRLDGAAAYNGVPHCESRIYPFLTASKPQRGSHIIVLSSTPAQWLMRISASMMVGVLRDHIVKKTLVAIAASTERFCGSAIPPHLYSTTQTSGGTPYLLHTMRTSEIDRSAEYRSLGRRTMGNSHL